MIPIFKSDFSIGKSILRLDEKSFEEDLDSSIFKILASNGAKDLILVEDTMIGFLEAYSNCSKLGINLIFGLNILCNSSEEKIKDKYIIFSKNENGCKSLNKIYSYIHSEHNGSIDLKNLKKFWNDDLLMYIPFYDSFLYNNFMNYSGSMPTLSHFNPCFFIQDNALPFDHFLKESINKYCSKYNYTTKLCKSIYYNKRDDFSAYQVYKCLCSRNFSNKSTLESPNLDHCSSTEFCYESYLNHESS
jgi:DNA polymerase III alpha subunit